MPSITSLSTTEKLSELRKVKAGFAEPISGPQPSHDIVNEAIGDLSATQGGSYDLRERIAALRTLQTLGVETDKLEPRKKIVREFEKYVANNVSQRKSVGNGVRENRGTYRAEDIVAAIEGLQTVRRSSGGAIKVKLSSIDFDRANLVDLGLEEFNFTHSTFRNVFLTRSNLKGAAFDHADLSGAVIWNADMSNAEFYGAKLHGTKFVNVQLGGSNIEDAKDRNVAMFGARGLSREQLEKFPRYDP